MAIKLGEIFVSLGLSTASFTKGLNDAKQLAFGNSKEIARSFQIIATAALGVATSLVFMVKSSIDAADKLHDLSLATGVSVESLSRLGHAAALSGVDQEGMAKGLQKLQKAAVEAAQGNKELNDWFRAFGIDVKNAGGDVKNAEQLFLELSDSVRDAATDSSKSSLIVTGAMKLMGKAGAEQLPLLMEDLRAVGREADALGKTISTEFARDADEFNDNITRLRAALDGLINQMAGPAAGGLANVAEGLRSVAKENGKVAASLMLLFFPDELREIGKWERAMKEFAEVLTLPEKEARNAARETASEMAAKLAEAQKAAKKHAEAIQGILDKMREQIATVGQGATALELYRLKQEGASAAVLENARALGTQLEFLKATQALFAKTAEGAAAHEKALSEILGTDALSRARAEIEAFEAEVIPGLAPSAEMLAAWDALTDKLRNLGIIGGMALKDLQRPMNELLFDSLVRLNKEVGSLAKNIGRFGEEAISSFAFAVAHGQSLRAVFKGLLQDLIALVLKMIIFRTILSIFGGLFGGGAKIGGGDFPDVSLSGAGGHRAHGGPVFAGQPFLVGERGPELFVPHLRGDILPNAALRAGGAAGGLTIVNNVDNRGADLGTTAKMALLVNKLSLKQFAELQQERQARTA